MGADRAERLRLPGPGQPQLRRRRRQVLRGGPHRPGRLSPHPQGGGGDRELRRDEPRVRPPLRAPAGHPQAVPLRVRVPGVRGGLAAVRRHALPAAGRAKLRVRAPLRRQDGGQEGPGELDAFYNNVKKAKKTCSLLRSGRSTA